jgi:opacity protein-like surface antigen
MSLAYNRAELYAGITHSFTALVMPLGLNTRVGISYIGLNSGEMEVNTVEEPMGTGVFFDVTNTAIGITLSQSLTDRFTIGITGKWIQEKIQRSVANGIALDLGSTFNTGLLGTRLGMTIQNVGPKMKMSGPDFAFEDRIDLDDEFLTAGIRPDAELATLDYDIPLMFRLGVAMDVLGGISTFMPNDQNRVTALVDIEDANDFVARVGLSVEYAWNEMVFGRLGYRIRTKLSDQLGARLSDLHRETFELGYGLGLKTEISGYAVQLDYGIADYGVLGSVSQLFLSLGF